MDLYIGGIHHGWLKEGYTGLYNVHTNHLQMFIPSMSYSGKCHWVALWLSNKKDSNCCPLTSTAAVAVDEPQYMRCLSLSTAAAVVHEAPQCSCYCGNNTYIHIAAIVDKRASSTAAHLLQCRSLPTAAPQQMSCGGHRVPLLVKFSLPQRRILSRFIRSRKTVP